MPSILPSLRPSLRSLRRDPVFTLVAVGTLALGLGANTALFTVLRGVLLTPPPYPEPDRIVRVGVDRVWNLEFLDHFAERATTFEALAAYTPSATALTGGGAPEQILGAKVTPAWFDVFGTLPALGRGFLPEERVPGAADVAVVSHRLWQERLGSSPDVLDETVTLDGRAHRVIGVLGADHEPLDPRWQVYTPLATSTDSEEYWDWITYRMVGRLSADATADSAREQLRSALESYREIRPDYLSWQDDTTVATLFEASVRDSRPVLGLLLGATLAVLLVAIVNVAHLLVARIAGRRRELALRTALGASRSRLFLQIAGETVAVSLAGGLLGLLASSWGTSILTSALPLPPGREMPFDGAVFGAAALLATATGVAVARLATFGALRGDLRSALGAARGSSAGPAPARLQASLVAVETGLATLLVFGAILLLASFSRLLDVDPGFRTERIVTARVSPPAADHPDEATRRVFFERTLEAVRSLPGVEAAALVNRVPLTPGDIGLGFRLDGRERMEDLRSVSVRITSPEFLDVFGIPLVRGRGLVDADRADTTPVGLVNESLARRLVGDGDAVGERLVFDTGEPWFTIVGVVADFRQHTLDRPPRPQVYRPVGQATWEPGMALALRTAFAPDALRPSLEKAVWSVDPRVPVTGLATMEEIVGRTVKRTRRVRDLVALFALLALGLGAVGVYGVTAQAVRARAREHGIRLALGARGSEIVRGTLHRTLCPVLAGLAGGIVLALLGAGALRAHLFEVAPWDPGALVAVVAVLLATGVGAGWAPARRAGRVDPMTVLRED